MAKASAHIPNRGGRPTRKESEERLSRLLDCAAEIFAQYGYAGTSIDRISTAAHVGKPTIYARYGSKDGLLKAVIDHVLKHRMVPVDQPIIARTAEGALKEQLANIIIASLEPSFLSLFNLYLNEGARFPGIFEAFSPNPHTHALLIKQLRGYPEFEQLRYTPDEVATRLLSPVGMMVTLAATQPGYRNNISAQEEAHRIVDITLHGVIKRD